METGTCQICHQSGISVTRNSCGNTLLGFHMANGESCEGSDTTPTVLAPMTIVVMDSVIGQQFIHF